MAQSSSNQTTRYPSPYKFSKYKKLPTTNGKFYVAINGTKSSCKEIVAGVPQESILGPLLFTLYINDLPQSTHTHTAIFAAILTAIYASSWSPTQATTYLQNHIDLLQNYFTDWKLKINPTKTQAITFTSKRNLSLKTIKISDHDIPWTHTVKDLGVILNSKITWVAATTKRVNLAYPALHRLIPLISKNSKLKTNLKLNLYNVRPIILYGHQIWASAANTHINNIQKIQNKFLRIILNKLYDTPIKTLHKIANNTNHQKLHTELSKAYNTNHPNPLIRNTGNYQIVNIPFKIKTKLPKHAITQ